MEEICFRLPSTTCGVRKAPRLPIALVISWELLVAEDAVPAFVRNSAWSLCVGTWASLRFDDHRGITPQEIERWSTGLSFDLSRTKSTGPGKPSELRP